MKATQPRQNYLGAAGWIWGGNYKLERYFYLLHRVTGLGLILFGVVHLTVTTFYRIQGQSLWEAAMSVLDNPLFKFGEYLVAFAFVIHALNGLRLMLQELGFALGRPKPPIYPYSDALRRKRTFTMILIAIILVLGLVFLFDFVAGGAQ